jgi:hypothetical protein
MERTVYEIERKGLKVSITSDANWFTVYAGDRIGGTLRRPKGDSRGWMAFNKDGRPTHAYGFVGPNTALLSLVE